MKEFLTTVMPDIFLFLLLTLLCVLSALKTSCSYSTNNTVEAAVCGFTQGSQIVPLLHFMSAGVKCWCRSHRGLSDPVEDHRGLRQDSASGAAEAPPVPALPSWV